MLLSQAQRIILGMKANFNLSPSYLVHKLLNHKSLFFVSLSLFLLNNNSLLKYFTKKPVRHNTPHILSNTSISTRKPKPHAQFRKCQPGKHDKTCMDMEPINFAGIQHGLQHRSFGTTNRVSCGKLKAHTGTGVSHTANTGRTPEKF